MAEENDRKTIEQEIEDLGIKPEYLDDFFTVLHNDHYDVSYEQCDESRQLPIENIKEHPGITSIPSQQYTALVEYLKSKGVIGRDNKIKPDGVIIFKERRFLELIVEIDFDVVDVVVSGGGVDTCYIVKIGGGIYS